MVVTRKKPTQPAPVASRTSSSQPVPRVIKAKAPQNGEDGAVNQGNGVSAGKDTRSSPPSKSKSKSKQRAHISHPPPKPPSLLDRLFFPSLLILFLYALIVCPTDTAHSHRICRSLSTYRQRILEPYILPPLRAAVSHPIIQEPYKTHVEPVLEKVVIYSEPVVKFAKVAEKKVTPVVVASYHRAQKVYEGSLVPYWNSAVVPRYHMHIAPHVERHIVPVYSSAERYITQLHPHIRALQAKVHHTQQTLEPYFTKAYAAFLNAYHKAEPHVHKAYITLRPHVLRLWAQTRPFLCRAWKEAQIQARVVFKVLMRQLRAFALLVLDARRQYVDPHILRIWEKASESSAGSFSSTSSVVAATTKGDTESIRLDDIPSDETAESTLSATPTLVSAVSPSPIPSDVKVEVPVEGTPTPEETEEPTPSATPIDEAEEEKVKAVSVAEESAAHASSVVAEIVSEVAGASVTPTPEPTQDAAETEAEPETTPEPVPTLEAESLSASSIIASSAAGASVLVDDEVVPTASAVPSTEEDEEDDDFLRDLGIDNPSQSQDSSPAIKEPEPPKPLTQEEKDAETAMKRKDIVGRHVRWQAELDSLSKEKERTVKKAIEDVRNGAVGELEEMSNGLRDNSGKLRSSKDGKKGGVVDGVQSEGEKLLKGVETYLAKATKRSESWKRIPGDKEDKESKDKKREEEGGKWGRVLEKVEERFGEVVRSVQGEVHGWYRDVREREIIQVLEAAREVKLLAERAQADIGLDYAWLEDVTYQDWQSYHDLMRTAESFEQTARSLQNSTHPSSPSDPLLGALNNLEREMQDVVAGFNVRISELSSEGRTVFSPFVDEEEADDTTYSVKDVPKDEVTADEILAGGAVLGKKEVVGVLDVKTPEEEEQVVLEIGGAAPVQQKEKKTEEAEEPKFSILPIDVSEGDEDKSENENVLDASKIVIGKSKEEVEGVLGGISHEEL